MANDLLVIIPYFQHVNSSCDIHVFHQKQIDSLPAGAGGSQIALFLRFEFIEDHAAQVLNRHSDLVHRVAVADGDGVVN